MSTYRVETDNQETNLGYFHKIFCQESEDEAFIFVGSIFCEETDECRVLDKYFEEQSLREVYACDRI